MSYVEGQVVVLDGVGFYVVYEYMGVVYVVVQNEVVVVGVYYGCWGGYGGVGVVEFYVQVGGGVGMYGDGCGVVGKVGGFDVYGVVVGGDVVVGGVGGVQGVIVDDYGVVGNVGVYEQVVGGYGSVGCYVEECGVIYLVVLGNGIDYDVQGLGKLVLVVGGGGGELVLGGFE